MNYNKIGFDTEEFDGIWKKLLKTCASLLIIAVIVFCINQNWFLWKEPFEVDKIGQFGDFIGGVIGTLVALATVYLLTKTLINQVNVNKTVEKSNNSVIATNGSVVVTNEKLIKQTELQLFDNKFRTLYETYLKIKDTYGDDNLTGQQKLDKIAKGMLKKESSDYDIFISASEYATKCFEDVYASFRHVMSVHFRMLYLLLKLIADAEIDEEDKVIYAKIIRGQLSDGELVLLRYNSLTPQGQKMQTYVRNFNLLKHLPLMDLMEFKNFRKLIVKQSCLEAVNCEFIKIKKALKNALSTDERGTMELSYRYSVVYVASGDGSKLSFRLRKKNSKKRGGGKIIATIERALDLLDNKQLEKLFFFFLQDTFKVSSFNIEDKLLVVKKNPVQEIEGHDLLKDYTVSNDSKLIL